jgi:hypothetical protein
LTSSSAPSRSTKASSARRRPSTAHAPPLGAEPHAGAPAVVGVRSAQQVSALDHLVGQLARRLAAHAQQLGQPRDGRLLGVDGADDEAEGRACVARSGLAHGGREAIAEAAVGGHEKNGQIRFVNHGRLSTIVA